MHIYTNPKSKTVPPVHPKSELSFEQLTDGSRSWRALQSCRILIENWPKELQNQPIKKETQNQHKPTNNARVQRDDLNMPHIKSKSSNHNHLPPQANQGDGACPPPPACKRFKNTSEKVNNHGKKSQKSNMFFRYYLKSLKFSACGCFHPFTISYTHVPRAKDLVGFDGHCLTIQLALVEGRHAANPSPPPSSPIFFGCRDPKPSMIFSSRFVCGGAFLRTRRLGPGCSETKIPYHNAELVSVFKQLAIFLPSSSFLLVS